MEVQEGISHVTAEAVSTSSGKKEGGMTSEMVLELPQCSEVPVLSRKKSALYKSKRRRKMLHTISGIRTFATLWIVLGHFQDTNFRYNRDTTFLLVLSRGFIAVGIYIVLSGFMTHYAYQNRHYSSWQSWCAFYLRRVARVVFTYEASCLLGLCDPLFTRHDALATLYPLPVASTCLLIQSWFELPWREEFARDFPNSPNPGGWTISTLLFAWLLYPLLNAFMHQFNRITKNAIWAKFLLAIVFYALSMFPCVWFYIQQDGIISNQQFEFIYKYPPLRIGDFMLGVIVAELVNDPRVTSWKRTWAFLPDILVLAFSLFVSLCAIEKSSLDSLPDGVEQPLIRENGETFLISGLSPMIAVLLLGYGINSGRSDLGFSITSLLEHRAIEGIGVFSFTVYCFQFTIFFMFEEWQHKNTGIDAIAIIPHLGTVSVPAKLIAGYLMPYLLFLFCFAGAWTLWIEQPVAQRIAMFSKQHLDTPSSQHKPCVEEDRKVLSSVEHNTNELPSHPCSAFSTSNTCVPNMIHSGKFGEQAFGASPSNNITTLHAPQVFISINPSSSVQNASCTNREIQETAVDTLSQCSIPSAKFENTVEESTIFEDSKTYERNSDGFDSFFSSRRSSCNQRNGSATSIASIDNSYIQAFGDFDEDDTILHES